MVIQLDEAVHSFMDEKGKETLTLLLRRSGGGWCGAIEVPDVELRVPAAPNEYNKFEVEGKTVYVHKRVKAVNSGLKFRIRKVFFVRSVIVEGLLTAGM